MFRATVILGYAGVNVIVKYGTRVRGCKCKVLLSWGTRVVVVNVKYGNKPKCRILMIWRNNLIWRNNFQYRTKRKFRT